MIPQENCKIRFVVTELSAKERRERKRIGIFSIAHFADFRGSWMAFRRLTIKGRFAL